MEDDIAVTDPTVAIDAWVTRMSLRHGEKCWDQEASREVGWKEALLTTRYPDKEWIVSPLWTPSDCGFAEAWERQTWPQLTGTVFWPLRFMPMKFRDTRLCDLDDHNFVVTKVPEEDGMILSCLDPCTNPIARYDHRSQQYMWSPCVHIEQKWADDFRDHCEFEFPVKIAYTTTYDDMYDDVEVSMDLQPVFLRNSQVCPSCGREIRPPQRALSRRKPKTYVCPRCGQREAIEDFCSHKLL